ncbi:ABC transporter substrate-binding protein [Pseudarthrobacter sp. AB1]|uniref:taurine ABC transporter substrate-binding protein n=1 Tax=Pseudarthrobacter sp. AB1 TaxID=2138309 RepID=UPI00186B729A|nr:ABC transporter substrate-binding protein [Pseudarthrobacter sp. AB1]
MNLRVFPRRLTGPIAILALLALATACAGPTTPEAAQPSDLGKCSTGSFAQPETASIGYFAEPNQYMSLKTGTALSTGLTTQFQWKSFNSGADVNTAMASGALDMSYIGGSPAASGIAQGLNYKIIGMYYVAGENEALIAKSSSGVKAVEDLAGKTVGVPLGSTSHYALMNALRLAGVSEQNVKVLNLSPQQMVAAWQRGDIDAGYVWEPARSQLLNEGGRMITNGNEMAAKGYPTTGLAIVQNDFAKKYPCVVLHWMEKNSEATVLAAKDPQTAASAFAGDLGLTPKFAAEQLSLETLWPDSQQITYFDSTEKNGLAWALADTAKFLQEQNYISNAPSQDAFRNSIDSSFLKYGQSG